MCSFLSHTAADLILESLAKFTPPGVRFDTTWMVIAALVYRTIFAVVGCYITAASAPRRAMLHAMILGAIGVVLTIVGVFASIHLDLGPTWYAVSLVVISLPCAWLGGKFYVARSGHV